MKIPEVLLGTPMGECLIKQFLYSNKRTGFRLIQEGKPPIILTLNIGDRRTETEVHLRLYGDAKPWNEHLLKVHDIFKVIKNEKIGHNNAKIVTINETWTKQGQG